MNEFTQLFLFQQGLAKPTPFRLLFLLQLPGQVK